MSLTVAYSRATSSPRLDTPTFSKIALQWSRTVWGDRNRCAAISPVSMPRVMHVTTSRSRTVRPNASTMIGTTSTALAGSRTTAIWSGAPERGSVSTDAWATSQRPLRPRIRARASPPHRPAAIARARPTTVNSSVGIGRPASVVAGVALRSSSSQCWTLPVADCSRPSWSNSSTPGATSVSAGTHGTLTASRRNAEPRASLRSATKSCSAGEKTGSSAPRYRAIIPQVLPPVRSTARISSSKPLWRLTGP